MIALTDAAVTALGVSVARVYREGHVPTAPTYPYLTVSATYDQALGYTLDAAHGVGDYRVTTMAVSGTYDGAVDTDARARAVLLDHYLTGAGHTYGPGRLQVGSAVVRDPDGGQVITVTSTYLFACEE